MNTLKNTMTMRMNTRSAIVVTDQVKVCTMDHAVGSVMEPVKYKVKKTSMMASWTAMMTTDKTLLELAAKAAGMRIFMSYGEKYAPWKMGDTVWNPLTDDGDALRLAVKLRMVIDCVLGAEYVEYFLNGHIQYINIDITDDLYAATRRAIVRAAAAIGESM